MAIKFLNDIEASGEVQGTSLDISGDASILSGAGSGSLTVGRNSNENIVIDVGDQVNSITAYQDSDSNSTHNFILNRTFLGSGANNFIIQKGGTAQLTLDTSANATFAGTIGSGAITSTGKIQGTELEGTSLDINGLANITAAAGTSHLLTLHNTSNASGASINFSDVSNATQTGTIGFLHADTASQGGGSSFHVTSTESDMVLVVGGRVAATAHGSNSEVDYGFVDDIDTGMMRSGANALRFVAGGTTVADIGAGQFTVTGEVEATSLDINGNADISGNLTSSASSTIGTPKIIMQADGTLDWGAAKDYGTLTWDTGYALIDGRSGKGIKFRTNGSSLALTLDTSQNATFAGNVVPAGIVLDGNTVTGIDDSNEFTDDDAHIMTSAAINDRFATYNWVNSRGENLFSNGSGLLGDITNMPGFTFDGSNANNSPGSFKWTGTGTASTSEFIPVDASRKYKMQYDAKTENGVGKYYGMTTCFDVDGNGISASHHMYRANTLTTLAVELVNGATTMTLTDSANWNNAGTAGVSNHLRSLIRWDYANSFGYTYPEETYSRNYLSQAWDPGDINFTTHVITLRVAWAGGTIAAGTKVSNGSSGGTYKYNVMSNKLLTTDWVRQTGYMDGVDYSGTNNSSKFPPGTAKIKLGWLMNYQNLQQGEVAWFTNLNVGVAAHEDDEIADAVERATDSNTFTDADHTKLNAIEASADVTDATNVTAAGALMDSEVTNLAQVKAFNSSDYATAAQGSTADSALQSDTNYLKSNADDTFSGALISTARDRGIFGTYDSYKTDQIWSMGSAYKNNSSGADFGNLYGLAYKHTNNTTGGTMASGHQMVWCTNGNPQSALGTNIWTGGSVTATSLDINGNADISGNLVIGGTVDGIDIATDVSANTDKISYNSAASTKLGTIETSADVTDATNVTAAGALMDSEVTNLTQVKAFDTTDYATAAQGSTADSALQSVPNHSGGLITTGTVAAARVATLNQNTTGTAAGLSTTLVAGSGGTGLTSISTLLNSNVTSVSGNAGTVTINSDFTGTYPLLVEVTSSGVIYNNPSITYNGSSDTLTSPNFSGNLTGNVTGNVTGSSGSCTGLASQATNLNATDDRNMAPEDYAYSDDFRVFFSSKEGLEDGSTSGTNYQDVLYMNSYNDSSGGDANVLAFDKSEKAIYHYQADQAATNWGTAKQLAYTDSDVSGDTTGNAATVTTNANLTGHITSSGNAAVLGSFTVAQLSAALSNASISGNNTGDQTVTNSTSTTSSTTVASATAVKAAYDRGSTGITNAASAQTTANDALPTAGGTMSGAIAMGGNNITGGGTITGTTLTGTSLDMNGNANLTGRLTVGVNDAGHDVILYGNTANKKVMWDTSVDHLKLYDNTKIVFGTGGAEADYDGSIYWDQTDLVIDSESDLQILSDAIVTGDVTATGSVTAKTYDYISCGYYDDIGTSLHYLPLNGKPSEQLSEGNSYTDWVAPCHTTVKSIQIRFTSIIDNGDITMTVWKDPIGSGTKTSVEAETVSVTSAHNNDLIHFLFDGAVIEKGETMKISIQATGGMSGANTFVTVVLLQDWNDRYTATSQVYSS